MTQRAQRLIARDELTGLLSRRGFREQVEATLGRPRRGHVAVIALDLDRFNTVNDSLGHAAGDRLLQEVAKRLCAAAPRGAAAARTGGDEFALLLTGAAARHAEEHAHQLAAALGEPYRLDAHRARIGVSLGVVLTAIGANEAERLLRRADIALHAAKNDGGGICRLFSEPMEVARLKRLALEVDLREAIAREDIELHYQPIFALGTDRLSGFEALARWQRPGSGAVPPAEFIPLAEETGLIVPLGEFVLRRACRDAATWPAPLSVAVNFSALQFAAADLADLVGRVLAETGLAPTRLEIEITESALLHRTESVLATLRRLRQAGVRVALDDFGTQYSTLSCLREFAFDRIKIDQSFVRDAIARPDCRAIVRSVASLAIQLGIQATAEGVENEHHLDIVRELGCTAAQGYYLGRPSPAPAFGAVAVRAG